MAGQPDTVRDIIRKNIGGLKDITKADLTLSAGSAVRQREKVASVKFKRPQVLAPGRQVRLTPMAYETKETNGTGGDTETFDLSHDLIDSDATPTSLVLYEEGQRVQPDSVDYDGNSFDYTDDGTANTLGVYYAAADQAPISLVKQNAGGISTELWTGDIGLIHRRDNDKEPITLSFQSFWERVIPEKWELAVYVNTPYQVAWAQDIDSDGEPEPATNALVSVPRQQVTTKVDGLRPLVRQAAAEY